MKKYPCFVYGRDEVIKKFGVQGRRCIKEFFLGDNPRGYARYHTVCREHCEGVSGIGTRLVRDIAWRERRKIKEMRVEENVRIGETGFGGISRRRSSTGASSNVIDRLEDVCTGSQTRWRPIGRKGQK